MERRYPLTEIDAETTARLLRAVPGMARPRRIELLVGGHINTNYVVMLDDGRRIVLRIFRHGEALFRKETDVLRTLQGTVPVPRLHAAVYDLRVFEYPYEVLEWVDGVSMNDALIVPGAASQIGELVAATLIEIGRHALTDYPFPPFVDFIDDCLARGAADWLGQCLSARLRVFAREQNKFLADLCPSEGLVHGDFQGDNILLCLEEARWHIAAVIDWEWAHQGCYLQDLGSLLRFSGAVSRPFQQGIENVFKSNGLPLPPEWMKAARIWDLASQCEKLAWPQSRGEVTARSISAIKQCLADYSA